jgi:hypothetical protein
MAEIIRFVQEFPSLSGPHQTEPVPEEQNLLILVRRGLPYESARLGTSLAPCPAYQSRGTTELLSTNFIRYVAMRYNTLRYDIENIWPKTRDISHFCSCIYNQIDSMQPLAVRYYTIRYDTLRSSLGRRASSTPCPTYQRSGS